MVGAFKALFVLVLLGVPLLVVSVLPRFLEVAGSVPSVAGPAVGPTPSFRLPTNPTLTPDRGRLSALNETPPPTLSPPLTTATAAGTAQPKPTGERVVVTNTGGIGAV